MANLDGRVALVTGAGRGIGRAIALELGRQGATVVANYHQSADGANEVVAAIEAQGGQAIAHQADVTSLEAVTAMIKAITQSYEKLDILVNNAGTTRDQLIMMMKPDDWSTVLETNLTSAWNCCKAAVRGMVRKRYGRIINITSVSGIAGQAGQTNYSASKAGLIGLTRALAREVADRNITVNAVAPGFIPTDMTSGLSEDLINQVLENIPMKRLGAVDDVAHAVAFFASEQAGYITGQILTVDGGLVMG
ncbi:MAG: 3-oxoacyl-[acyl-carrier-protein] reductase [Chloroflexi bacterium]|nr:3-oxoacyl-[acyl-carrier-protein] reductase [Chloroflexota bacterium]